MRHGMPVPQDLTSLLDHDWMRSYPKIIGPLSTMGMDQGSLVVSEHGNTLWLCQPMGSEINIERMPGNGNIDLL